MLSINIMCAFYLLLGWCYFYQLANTQTTGLYINKSMNVLESKNKIIGQIDVLDAMITEFDIIVHSSVPYRQASLLTIGSRHTQRYPFIGLDASSTKLITEFSTILKCYDYIPYDFSFVENQCYHIYFKVNHTHFIVKINDEYIVNYDQFDTHLKPNNMSIYLCNDDIHPDIGCANVTITNLNVTTYTESSVCNDNNIPKKQKNRVSIIHNEPIYPTPGLRIGTIDILDVMIFEFDITVYEIMEHWNNILQIGSRTTQRYPLIAMHPNEARPHVRMSTTNYWNDGINIEYVFKLNKTNHIYIEISHTKYLIKINGITVDDYNHYDSHLKPKQLPIWICADIEPYCSKVKIENLNITTFDMTHTSLFQTLSYIDKTIKPKPNLLLGTIDIQDSIIIQVDIIVHDHGKDTYQHILQIASRTDIRFPLLELIRPPRGTIGVTMTTNATFADGIHISNWKYELNKSFHLYIEINQTEYLIIIDNITYVHCTQFDGHSHQQNLAVYACGPWVTHCANVTMRNLIIKAKRNIYEQNSVDSLVTKIPIVPLITLTIFACLLVLCGGILLMYRYKLYKQIRKLKRNMYEEGSVLTSDDSEQLNTSTDAEFSEDDSTNANNTISVDIEELLSNNTMV
eukprot:211586_1